MKLDFPVICDVTNSYPTEALCPWCKKYRVLEPHSFAVLGGGAMLKDKDGDSGPSQEMEGFFHLAWHSAHDEGKDKNQEADGLTEVVKDVYVKD